MHIIVLRRGRPHGCSIRRDNVAQGQEREHRGSFWRFWTTLPGVLTAFAGVVTAVTGLVAILVTAGVFGGSPAGQGPGVSATSTPGASFTATAGATGTVDLTGRWSVGPEGGYIDFEKASALAQNAYEFQEYNARNNVIGGGEGVLEGAVFSIHYAQNEFIGEYTGELHLSADGATLSGPIRPKLSSESAITLRRR
jgi:hypothetical protein